MIKNKKLLRFVKVLFTFIIFSLSFSNLFAEENSHAEQKTETFKSSDLQKDDSDDLKEVSKDDIKLKNPETENSLKINGKESEVSQTDENSQKTEASANSEKKDKKQKKNKDKSEETKSKSSSTITILSAQKTEYSKSEIGADVIELTGDVKIKVELDGSGTIIYADKVSYERKRQRLFAEGNVVLERLSGSTVTERLTATSVLFNAETQEGVFSEGRVAQSNSDMFKLDTNSKLVVDSDIFGRDDSGVIGFKNGSLTFCDAEDPHWKIDASRIWLLPGNEFAFVNARFFVGSLLTLWLPFFYYPKDEMIFNPVIGTDDRKGYFLHTSTYLVGRKPLESATGEDDYFSF